MKLLKQIDELHDSLIVYLDENDRIGFGSSAYVRLLDFACSIQDVKKTIEREEKKLKECARNDDD